MDLTFVVNQELVETTARGNHGKDRDLAVGDDLQESGALLLNEPLQLGLNVGGARDTLGSNAHGASKRDEVGVLLVGVGVTVLVEQILPAIWSATCLVIYHIPGIIGRRWHTIG